MDLFRSAQYKDLRKELYPLIEERIRREGAKTDTSLGVSKNLNGRISAALIDGRFDDAL